MTSELSEPDCLGGLLVALVATLLVTVIVILSHPTADERQLLLDRLGQSSGVNWTHPLR